MNDWLLGKQMFQFHINFLNIKLNKLILNDKALSYQLFLKAIIKVFCLDNSLATVHTFWHNPLG